MKKLENFSWKMWQVYALAAMTIFMIGGICSFFFLKEASYVISERNYYYIGEGQRLTDYLMLDEEDTGLPIIALSFKKDDEHWSSYSYVIGRHYLALQDSKLNKSNQDKKDSEEYFKIRYYQLGKEDGEGQIIDVLKLAQDKGYPTINGSMDSIMYSDGKDDYVGVNLSDKDYLFINLRTQEVSQKRPKETIQFGYSGIHRFASLAYYTADFYKEKEKIDISLPWIHYQKEKASSYDRADTSSSSEKKAKDSKLLTLLKKYGFLVVLQENLTSYDRESLIRNLYSDASDLVWVVDSDITKSGETEYVHTEEELQQVIDEGKVKKDEE
ncbi:hypothetical protein [Streptococcus australis]|uniref:hypothetical protein n=1 Tax=Streptococcus australis TaxID=113107 RepID=UPI00232E4FE4|nr:hypothetical protein [Streptococcus australis]MDB8642207.1 hypothetical protein [Streptococcus australis]MDB8646131.1 hypothetical protein [Streptococcus australis]